MESELPVILKVYDVYKHLVETNIKLPKIHRYSLGQGAETATLDLLEKLVMAKHAPRSHKPRELIKALAYVEAIRFRLRLYLDLGLANETKVFQIQAELKEIGRMCGGWKKSINT